METAAVADVSLEYVDSGTGDPVVCIHGAFVADVFEPLASDHTLTDRYRLIRYHRRGYGGSSPSGAHAGLTELARDCQALLSYLGVTRAHLVGHSLGGAIALQLALDAPERVHTVSLLEAALMIGESAKSYRQALAQSMRRYRDVGAHAALDESLTMRWPAYREPLERALPGAFQQAVNDAPTSFEADIPALMDWRFDAAQARRIRQPVLVVLGEMSATLHPRFEETYRLLLNWLPDAEGSILPDAKHFLQVEDPASAARCTQRFLGGHPLHV